MRTSSNITVTVQDLRRLEDLLTSEPTSESPGYAEQLDLELARAKVVAQTEVAHDVVTMNKGRHVRGAQYGHAVKMSSTEPRPSTIIAQPYF